jgi:predicted phage-related endonuclease
MADYIEHRKIGGTAACVIARGKHFKMTLQDLWEETTRKKERPDLSWELNVQLGIMSESLNAKFFTHNTELEVERNGATEQLYVHPEYNWLVAQIDGLVHLSRHSNGIWEAKHTNAFSDIEKQADTYYPQVQHYMNVLDKQDSYISAIFGNSKWECIRIPRDQDFIDKMMELQHKFWKCVIMDIPPKDGGIEETIEPTKPIVRKVDMTGNNQWASLSLEFIDNQQYAKLFEDAKSDLKKLVPIDARETTGHGIIATRDKRGACTIKVA